MNTLIEKHPSIRWWMRKTRLKHFTMGFYTLLIISLIFIVLSFVGFDKFKTSDLVFGIIASLIFVAYAFYELYCFFKSFGWKITSCQEGTVKDKLQTRLPNRHIKDSIIIADVSDDTINSICLPKTYCLVKKGDPVLLFTIGTDKKVYCVHKV